MSSTSSARGGLLVFRILEVEEPARPARLQRDQWARDQPQDRQGARSHRAAHALARADEVIE